ncbi:MAG: PEP-CTERM sorting domain-containing protein [Verrucomicrobiota bacterium JB022]|nr:PEP-CTERM sorting domain-containing protein [Verrucomicrobiota bacterium JB022]
MSTALSYRERISARKQRLQAPSTAAAALALGVIASSAQAAVSYHLTPGVTDDAINVNPLTDEITTGSYSSSDAYPIAVAICNTNILLIAAGQQSGSVYDSFLNDGDTVDSSLEFITTISYTNLGSVELLEPIYLGFRFENQGAGSDETYYGYLELQATTFSTLELIGYAIGGNNEAVAIGAVVPEPSTYALMLGTVTLLGVAGYRQRKRRLAATQA